MQQRLYGCPTHSMDVDFCQKMLTCQLIDRNLILNKLQAKNFIRLAGVLLHYNTLQIFMKGYNENETLNTFCIRYIFLELPLKYWDDENQRKTSLCYNFSYLAFTFVELSWLEKF